MTQFPNQPPTNPQPIPSSNSATTGLVLGIISILFSVPILGLILAYLGMSFSKKAQREIAQGLADRGGEGVAKAGYICSIIGMVLSAISTLLVCVYLGCIGIALFGGAAGAAAGSHP